MQLLVVMMFACAIAANVSAQPVRRTVGSAYYRSGSERWLYPGERADRARWQLLNAPVEIDSISAAAPRGGRVFDSHRGYGTESWTRAWRRAGGDVDSVSVRLVPRPNDMGAVAFRNTDDTQQGVQEADAARPAVDFLDHYLMFLGGAPRAGRRVNVRIRVQLSNFAHRVDGTLMSRRVRDTLVGGRPWHVIRDSGTITLTDDTPTWERTLFAARLDRRSVAGTVVAWRLYDPDRDITVAVTDTTTLRGRETRRYPDGREYSSGLRYDRRQTVTLLDSAGLRARLDLESRAYGFGVGMVIRPPVGDRTPDVREQRVQDSLIRAYQTATTTSGRDSIEALGDFWYLPGVQEQLAHIHLREGDTANAIRLMDLGYGKQLSPWMYELLRPILNDPGEALRFGISANEIYEAFEYAFKYTPTVLARDSAEAWCVPSVCRLVADEWDVATEPRLRTIGLMARYSMDPARWADSMTAVATAGNRQLAEISQRARGIRRQRTGDPGIPIPPPSADWRAWLIWLRGASEETLARRDSVDAARALPAPRSLGRIALRTALRIDHTTDVGAHVALASRRHDVSYRDSIAARFAGAPNDTARYVFGVLLHELGAPARAPEAVFDALISSRALDRALSRMEIRRLPFAPADSATSADIEQTLLNRLIDSLPLWAPLDSAPFTFNSATPIHRRDSTYVLADSLGAMARQRLRQAGIPLHDSRWRLPVEASGRLLQISGVSRAGAFARVHLGDTYLVRLADGRGGGNDQGGVFWLVLINGVWRLVDEDSWVT